MCSNRNRRSAHTPARLQLTIPSPATLAVTQTRLITDPASMPEAHGRCSSQYHQWSQRQLSSTTMPRKTASVLQKALEDPLIQFGPLPSSLSPAVLSSALRVGAGSSLRCPARILTTTLDETDGWMLWEHSDEVGEGPMLAARRARPTEGGGVGPLPPDQHGVCVWAEGDM